MKNIVILATFSLVLLFASCQKNENFEVAPQATTEVNQKPTATTSFKAGSKLSNADYNVVNGFIGSGGLSLRCDTCGGGFSNENDTSLAIVFKRLRNKNAYLLGDDKRYAFRVYYTETSSSIQAIQDGGKKVAPASKEYGRWIVILNRTTHDTFKVKVNTKRLDPLKILKNGAGNVDTLAFSEVTDFEALRINRANWGQLQTAVGGGAYKAKLNGELLSTTINNDFFSIAGSAIEEFAGYGRLVTFRLFKRDGSTFDITIRVLQFERLDDFITNNSYVGLYEQ